MSQERFEQTEASLARLSSAVDVLVSEFIRPSTQQAIANYQRLERIEAALETSVQCWDRLEGLVEANILQSRANEQQIAANAEGIAENKLVIANLGEGISEQSQQIQVLIKEGRADRQAQREALAAIMSNANRIEAIERKAS
ncbi:MAG: hypothetical protein AAF703_14475 [Cyanobacteria bacterium P01_D01_bin.105]